MKSVKNKIKLLSILLTSLILFKSCRVYHKEHVTLDRAVAEGKRVKLMTKDGQKFKFKRVVLDSGQYYGINKVKGKTLSTLIQSIDIESLRLHNKTMSIIYGTGIGWIISGVVFIVIFTATWDGPNFNLDPIQFPN